MRRGGDSGRGGPDDRGLTRFGAAFVALIAVSGGTMALQGGASLWLVGATMVGATLVGASLLWYLRRTSRELSSSRRF